MANINLYNQVLKIREIEELALEFNKTLIDTNMTFDYFVDWEKVKKNINKLKVEINILNSLIGSKDVCKDLKKLLEKYPEVLPVIPIIIAVRKNELKVIEDTEVKKFSFRKKNLLTKPEILSIISFCEKTGIISLFNEIKIGNLNDYLCGVEVGMDTNARKNRSGSSMESIVLPDITSLKKKFKDLEIIYQQDFGFMEDNYDIGIPESLRKRKFDFVIVKNNQFINVEVNYYSGGGSKPQEIVNSYIDRQNELKKSNWHFIWITDGLGWRAGFNQIKIGIEKIDYLLNLKFIKEGLLERIIERI